MAEKNIRTPDLKTNSTVMHSSSITDSRYSFTNLEMNIFAIILAAAQQDLRQMIDVGIRDGLGKITVPEYKEDIQVKFYLDDFDMNRNEQDLVRAAKSLVSTPIETLTPTGWIIQPPVSLVEYNKQDRSVLLTIRPMVWKQILNVDHGYSEYELFTMMGLKSRYSKRFLMISASVKDSKEYMIDDLRKRFKMEKKYNTSTNFLIRVVDSAKAELDEKSAISFDYEKIKRPGTKEVVGIILKPKRNIAKIDREIEAKKLTHGRVQVGMSLKHEEIVWLRNKFAFTDAELNSNFGTFNTAKKLFRDALLDEMSKIYESMLRNGRGNQKGYFIRSLANNTEALQKKIDEQNNKQK